MSETEKGQRRIEVSIRAIESVFTRGWQYEHDGIPETARLVRMFPGENKATYWLVFESAEWEPLMEGEVIPELDSVEP